MRTLFIRSFALCLLTALLAALPAGALLMVRMITPDSKEESGMTVKYKRAKEGTYSFTVTRHNARAGVTTVESEAVDFQRNYSAYLEVRKGDQLLARTTVAAETQGNNLVYTFDLAHDCIKTSRFTVTEGVIPSTAGQVRSFWGDMYEVDMKEIDRRIQAAIPQHP